MSATMLIVGGLLVLSIVSGMLGLGVAFAAVPFLSLFLSDLVHEVQPLSLRSVRLVPSRAPGSRLGTCPTFASSRASEC